MDIKSTNIENMGEKKLDIVYNDNVFSDFLQNLKLPSTNILATTKETRIVRRGFEEIILENNINNTLDEARYLSKFIAACSIGLFDAGLNYIWNELVLKLRLKVINYDLNAFFNEAIGSKQRDSFQEPADLELLRDGTLLDTCKKLEIINPILYDKLLHISHMRNYIGASHPTVDTINAHELLGWLTICIKEISQPVTGSAMISKRIINNIKNTTTLIEEQDVNMFQDKIYEMSTNLCDSLLTSFFYIYLDSNTSEISKKNIQTLINAVWKNSTEAIKYKLASNIIDAQINFDADRKSSITSFFEIIEKGNKFFPQDTKIKELQILCGDFSDAIIGRDNFCNEPQYIKKIMSYIVVSKDIPNEVADILIFSVTKARIGKEVQYNDGISPRGKILYDKFFTVLNQDQVKIFIDIIYNNRIYVGHFEQIKARHVQEIIDNIIKHCVINPKFLEILDILKQEIKKGSTQLSTHTQLKQLIDSVV